LHESNGYVVHF